MWQLVVKLGYLCCSIIIHDNLMHYVMFALLAVLTLCRPIIYLHLLVDQLFESVEPVYDVNMLYAMLLLSFCISRPIPLALNLK